MALPFLTHFSTILTPFYHRIKGKDDIRQIGDLIVLAPASYRRAGRGGGMQRGLYRFIYRIQMLNPRLPVSKGLAPGWLPPILTPYWVVDNKETDLLRRRFDYHAGSGRWVYIWTGWSIDMTSECTKINLSVAASSSYIPGVVFASILEWCCRKNIRR